MNPPTSHRRIFAPVLLLGIVFGLSCPLGMIPSAEGASASASARIIKKLKKQIATLKAQLSAATAVPPTPAPFLEMVPVGSVGNAADAGNTSEPGVYGAVPYEYQIGKHEVTLAQYTAFLNAVAATDAYLLYNASMETVDNSKGIAQSGTSGSFTYSVIGNGDRPVTFVNWFDAARFCNWLHNGRPTGSQTAATTENGAYPLSGAVSSGLTITRNPGAKFWIPAENEWYKAAYHRPQSEGGPTDDFYLYPTASDTAPGNMTGDLPLVNQANFFATVYSVTQSAGLEANQNYLTAGGSYPGSKSFHGTFDQAGNVFEWNDAVIGVTSRGLRGGSWDNNQFFMRSSDRFNSAPTYEGPNIGFRVASP